MHIQGLVRDVYASLMALLAMEQESVSAGKIPCRFKLINMSELWLHYRHVKAVIDEIDSEDVRQLLYNAVCLGAH